MKFEDIQGKIGKPVTEQEAVDMLKHQEDNMGSTKDDVKVRGGVLSFSFGPNGLVLLDAEDRKAT